MTVTKKFKLATWNMQKGPGLKSSEKARLFDAVARSARYQVLECLKSNSDILFIQESPADIREESQEVDYSKPESREKAWISYDKKSDNQVHKSANRPSYWSNFTANWLDVPGDCPCNGKEDSFRLSVMARAATSIGYGIFISLHATSGHGAERNTQQFIEWLCAWVKDKHEGTEFVLIGADFNHQMNKRTYDVGDCMVSFRSPVHPTQQSGSSIDGFCCIALNPEISMTWWSPLRLCTGETDAPIETRMVMANPNIQQGFNQRGYLGKVKSGSMPGTDQNLNGPDMWIRMSDHCPVVCEIDLSRP